ncbi:MAG: TonB family protein [Hymenobacter sp.]|nr:TonB family protein [Hymenobacter sp.]
MPVYPGGSQMLLRDIANNLFYPAEARRKRIQGNVVVSFVVNTEGKMTDIRVKLRSSPSIRC